MSLSVLEAKVTELPPFLKCIDQSDSWFMLLARGYSLNRLYASANRIYSTVETGC